jgi:uncharacterized protein YbjT (DUF2867 family)
MKILVIGGTGNVGGEVVKELQKRNADSIARSGQTLPSERCRS